MAISLRMLFFLFWSFLVINVADLATAQDEVKVARCKHRGPAIRFPFWLRDQQQQGYPGFELSCNENKETVLTLPRSVKLFVKDIDYKAQQIHVYDPDNCLPKQLPNLNISASAFHFSQEDGFYEVTLLNCTSDEDKNYEEISCLRSTGYKVYALSYYYDYYTMGRSLVSCSKIADMLLPIEYSDYGIPQSDLKLNWSEPMCSKCEAVGKGCRMKINSTQIQPGCFNIQRHTARGTKGYIAPEVLSRNFGNVSHKSDVYSFGMLLLEMVGGRKNVDVTVESTSQVYFPEWIYNNLDKEDELGIIIEDERHAQIARKLTIVGLWCIQWHPADRPSMKTVVQMLEGEGDNLTMPPNPFASPDQMKMSATMNKRPFNRELAVISELE